MSLEHDLIRKAANASRGYERLLRECAAVIRGYETLLTDAARALHTGADPNLATRIERVLSRTPPVLRDLDNLPPDPAATAPTRKNTAPDRAPPG